VQKIFILGAEVKVYMAKIEGYYPDIQRVITGYWSLDRALGDGVNTGAPMTIYEVFGFQAIGKTTFVTYLAGMMAEYYKKDLVFAPVEHVSRGYMSAILDSANFTGVATILGGWDMVKKFLAYKPSKDNEYVTDEMLIDCLLSASRDPSYAVAVLDSLSAIMAVSEMESSVADANMGRKGKLLSTLSRGLVHVSRFRQGNDSPYAAFLLSHKYAPMGGGAPTNTGSVTTGGEMKKNISKIRIGLRRVKDPLAFYEDSSGTPYDNHAYVLEGKVEKNNFGREGKTFFVVGLGGQGLHHGLTAMYECKKLKIASFGKSITLGNQKFGSIRSAVERAHAGDDEFFVPFIEALKDPSKVSKVKEENEDADQFIDEVE